MQQRNLIGVLLLGRKCLDVISSKIRICKYNYVLSFPFFITANIIVPKGLAAKGSGDILHKKRYKITKWGNSKTM